LFHEHDYLKVFDNEIKLPLLSMNDDAGKILQSMHNEGVATQSIMMDKYYGKLCTMNPADDGLTSLEVIEDIVRRLTEARS
jgi:hypothetical protein